MPFMHSAGMGCACQELFGDGRRLQFLSYQLVFGRNPKLSCVMNDSLPALEGTTCSETLGKFLIDLHGNHKAFIAAGVSDRLRRALRHHVRPAGTIFQWRTSGFQEIMNKNGRDQAQ